MKAYYQLDNFEILFTQEIDTYLHAVIEMRDKFTYDNIYNDKYWEGGIYKRITADKLLYNQSNDKDSWYMFLILNNILIGYSRFSLNHSDKHSSEIHIIIIEKNYQGKKLMSGEKISKAIYSHIIEFLKYHSQSHIYCDICIYPIPNIPSLAFHHKLGFKPIQDLDITNLKSDLPLFGRFVLEI